MTDDVLLLIVGMICGVTAHVLGLGGGIILVPILSEVFKFPMHQAVGAALAVVTASSLFSSLPKLKQGLVAIKLATVLETISVIGALIGAIIALKMTGVELKKLFALLVTCMISVMILEDILRALFRGAQPTSLGKKFTMTIGTYWDEVSSEQIPCRIRQVPIVAGGVGLTAILGSMIGIGGNIVIVPLLTTIGGIPMRIATATSAYMMGLTTSGAAFLFWFHEHIRTSLVLCIIAGVYIGTRLAHRYLSTLKSTTIRSLFLLVLIASGVKMWLS